LFLHKHVSPRFSQRLMHVMYTCGVPVGPPASHPRGPAQLRRYHCHEAGPRS
jgi:hypothetical protein